METQGEENGDGRGGALGCQEIKEGPGHDYKILGKKKYWGAFILGGGRVEGKERRAGTRQCRHLEEYIRSNRTKEN